MEDAHPRVSAGDLSRPAILIGSPDLPTSSDPHARRKRAYAEQDDADVIILDSPAPAPATAAPRRHRRPRTDRTPPRAQAAPIEVIAISPSDPAPSAMPAAAGPQHVLYPPIPPVTRPRFVAPPPTPAPVFTLPHPLSAFAPFPIYPPMQLAAGPALPGYSPYAYPPSPFAYFPFYGSPLGGAFPGPPFVPAAAAHADDYERLLALDDSVRRPGLTPEVLDDYSVLQTLTAGDAARLNTQRGRCVVCLEDFEVEHTVRRLPCLCVFHKDCADRHFQESKTCPVCRTCPQAADQ